MHNDEFNFLQPIKSIKINKESKEKDNTLGKLKLCPPGEFFNMFTALANLII